MKKVAMNDFARRHTPGSQYSHFEGTEAELLALVESNLSRGVPGYADGVMLVPVPADKFRTGIVKIGKDSVLHVFMEARKPTEKPVQHVLVEGVKVPARHVDIVVYTHAKLNEDPKKPQASTDAEWEIVSVNARATEQPEPKPPSTLMRNVRGEEGGSRDDRPWSEIEAELAASNAFWSEHGMRWDGKKRPGEMRGKRSEFTFRNVPGDAFVVELGRERGL